MPRSRTVKSLAALVMAMTLGTFVLMLLELEAEPLRSPAEHLVAASSGLNEAALGADVPLQTMKWRNVIVHASPSLDGDLARGCHFLVRRDGNSHSYSVMATWRWRNQADGRHVFVRGYDYNRNSIGVCMIGDFSTRPPSPDQFDDLVDLVRQLRGRYNIPSEHVYLARQLPVARKSPGRAFPASLFEHLLRAPLY